MWHMWFLLHASSSTRIWEPFRKAKGPQELSRDLDLTQWTISKHWRWSCSTHDDIIGKFEDSLKIQHNIVEGQIERTWKALKAASAQQHRRLRTNRKCHATSSNVFCTKYPRRLIYLCTSASLNKTDTYSNQWFECLIKNSKEPLSGINCLKKRGGGLIVVVLMLKAIL